MSKAARSGLGRPDLYALFRPRSIAVVGAARETGKVGRIIFDNLIKTYKGPVYPVNPKAAEISGRGAYHSLAAIGKSVDLVVIAVPSKFASGALVESAGLGAKAAVVISAGFKETGIEGAKLEQELSDTAARCGIRLVGPNCLGIMDSYSGLNASFAGTLPPPGGAAFMSQSGALCTAILDWARGEEMGFSKFISLGNKADVSEVDLLPFLAADPDTKVITMYVEGITRGGEFMEAAREASREKPVIALKSGTTMAGARAVSSHTGTLAGSENVYKAAFRQSGVIRAETVGELFDFTRGFSSQPLPRGRRLAIITNAGGPGIIAADEAERQGLWLSDFTQNTIDILRKNLPKEAGFYNPVDVLGDALAQRYGSACRSVLNDPNVDSAVIILTPQAMTEIKETAAEIVRSSEKVPDKPVFAAFMGGSEVGKSAGVLREGMIPNFYFPERAVSMIDAMARYIDIRDRADRQIIRRPVRREAVGDMIAEFGKKRYLVDLGALRIVAAYGIETPKSGLARSLEQALDIAAEMNYPVVLKASSPEVLHKTDVGAVAVGVENDHGLRREYEAVLRNVKRYMPEADINGIIVQEMVLGARETIVGMNRDKQFGPLLMFGLGGIYVEILKDVSFRLTPVDLTAAREMVGEIRSRALLEGARGEERTDIDAIVDTIIRVSQLVTDWPGIAELDIHPLMVRKNGGGAVAADARILLEAGS